MINLSVSQGMFHCAWKSSVIVPILKIGDPQSASNYRPINILPLVSKVARKLMAVKYLNKSYFDLHLIQFGFRANYSTEMANCYFTEKVKSLLVSRVRVHSWLPLPSVLSCLFQQLQSNQIKSNHFYCHITTAQVPWWVKFLWACSRQCRKTTDNLHMDRQCKKRHWSIYSAPDSAKKNNNSNLHMDRQCKKTTTAIYIWTDSAKKTTAIYIWTVHIYRLYRRQCAKYTYMHSVRLVYYRDILNYQRHIIHRMGTSTLCTVSIHNVVYT